MVKVKECCCGCTLRTGSLILLWLMMVSNCFMILAYLTVLVYPQSISGRLALNTFMIFRYSYYLIVSLIVLTVSFLGIYGIQKNIPKYLNGIFYYFCYEAIFSLIEVLVLIFVPSWYNKLFGLNPFFTPTTYGGTPEYALVLVLATFFQIALTCYFALVCRSCRDAMAASKNNNNGISEIPDPAAVGYRVA